MIDASVLRSAGEKIGHSAHAGQVLSAVLEICHRAAFSADVRAEWDKHNSRIGAKWRASMVARKKLVKVDTSKRSHEILAVIDQLEASEKAKASLRKDVLVLATAASADGIVITGDVRLRELTEAHLKLELEWLVVHADDDEQKKSTLLLRLKELYKK